MHHSFKYSNCRPDWFHKRLSFTCLQCYCNPPTNPVSTAGLCERLIGWHFVSIKRPKMRLGSRRSVCQRDLSGLFSLFEITPQQRGDTQMSSRCLNHGEIYSTRRKINPTAEWDLNSWMAACEASQKVSGINLVCYSEPRNRNRAEQSWWQRLCRCSHQIQTELGSPTSVSSETKVYMVQRLRETTD